MLRTSSRSIKGWLNAVRVPPLLRYEVVSSVVRGHRALLGLLVAFVLVFAPAPEEGPGAQADQVPRGTLGARSLAPAVQEGNVSARPEHDLAPIRSGGFPLTHTAPASADSATVSSLFLALFSVVLLWQSRRRLLVFHPLVSRGPPSLMAQYSPK